jgi:hypothetical protein
MSIEKKSLISTLKTAKKANAASSGPEASHVVSKRQTKMVSKRQTKMVSKRQTKMVSKRAADRA